MDPTQRLARAIEAQVLKAWLDEQSFDVRQFDEATIERTSWLSRGKRVRDAYEALIDEMIA